VQSATAIRKAKTKDDEASGQGAIDPRLTLLVQRGERAIELCDSLIDITSALFGIASKELRQMGSARPSLEVTRIRQVAMYVAHVALGLSMRDVGVGFGRNHTTVVHACHLIEDLRDDLEFDRMVVMTERVATAAFRNRLETVL